MQRSKALAVVLALAAAVITPPATATAAVFSHPGVLDSRAQLDLVKAKIKAGAEPWKSAHAAMSKSKFAALSWTPKPRKVVECGPSSNPNLGCSDERNDAVAAYTHALLWHYTGNKAHATKSIQIMDAWSGTITGHTNHNAPLQTGWAGAVWPRAGEIIRYTGAGWAASGITRFSDMLRKVYLPVVAKGSPNTNGNWELVMIEATGGIGVFLDDKATFDKAVSMWRKRLPAYVYLKSDGKLPKPPPGGNKDTEAKLIAYWQGQKTFVDGLAQETCRDFGHTTWGLAAAIDFAETARHQGVDLYAEGQERLTKAMEFHATYVLGAKPPSWLCGGKVDAGTTSTWEIGYNHYHNRAGVPLTKSLDVIKQKIRPSTAGYFVAWETLTHAQNP